MLLKALCNNSSDSSLCILVTLRQCVVSPHSQFESFFLHVCRIYRAVSWFVSLCNNSSDSSFCIAVTLRQCVVSPRLQFEGFFPHRLPHLPYLVMMCLLMAVISSMSESRFI